MFNKDKEKSCKNGEACCKNSDNTAGENCHCQKDNGHCGNNHNEHKCCKNHHSHTHNENPHYNEEEFDDENENEDEENNESEVENVDFQQDPNHGIVKELVDQVKQLQDQVIRGYAEIENVKKRSQNEIIARTDSAISKFAKSIIPVFDTLNLTVQSFENSQTEKEIPAEFKTLIEGLKLVQQGFAKSLKEQGIEKVPTVGEKFDPNFHLAISQIEDDSKESGTILQEVQAGYTLNGKIIKEAMIILVK